ncbi:hypothetical protein GCM10010222_22950 [Streptomyces tanashiensis]|uniref:hypothetical protein n=1 Tax=Streptomyces tanashiensis TaxID=67367 RepID=UPI001679EA1E|nr:hypothetical protein [Streptomyces tanashiensis]GGS81067.1 hypothetical protein GCM10010222_22950 [Streptomyces tanashiensis]
MKITTKQAQDRRTQARGRWIALAAKKLGEWIVQGASSGAAREILRYTLDLWLQM